MELLLFLVLSFSSSVAAGEGIANSFQVSLDILTEAAKAIQIKDEDVFDLQNKGTEQGLLENAPFKPHVYTVRLTEPPMATPVQGFKDSWKRKKDPFFTPIPIADRPDIMKRIQATHLEERAVSSNRLLVACAAIFVILLVFGAAAIMGYCFYVLRLPPSNDDSSAKSLEEGIVSGAYFERSCKKQKVGFIPRVIESLDEMPTLTDESTRTLESRSESQTPAKATATSAAPPPPS